MNINFRKENEYLIEIFPQHFFRLICTKITKNPKGEIESYTFKNPVTNEISIYRIEEANKFITVIEPVDNLEMFKMYSNWLSFYRKGIHQDLAFAKQIAEQINETIKKRSYIMVFVLGFIFLNQKIQNLSFFLLMVVEEYCREFLELYSNPKRLHLAVHLLQYLKTNGI